MLGSCHGFLAEDPLTQVTTENFWQTRTDAERGLNSVYFGGFPFLVRTGAGGGWEPLVPFFGGLASGLFVDRRLDRPFTSEMQAGRFSLMNVTNEVRLIWHELYTGVNRANLVIYNIPRMTDVLSPDEIAEKLAQAKFFRALNYFKLVKNFGDVPHFEVPFTSPEQAFLPRTPSVEIYQAIERDLLAIINGERLPNTTFFGNNARVTLAMAQTLLAQVYLQWAGYPLNGGAQMYANAAAMARNVITGGSGHALTHPGGTTPDLNSAFNLIRLAKRGTPAANEIIFAAEFNDALAIRQGFSGRSLPEPILQYNYFADIALYSGYLPTPMITNSFHPDDIRGMEKQFFFRELDIVLNSRNPNLANRDTTITLGDVGNWFWLDKPAMVRGVGSANNIPLMRFAEVLLIAAEGLARTGNEAAARGYLNQVRRRAGLADNTDSGNDLIQAILTERLHEFPLEFLVWDDIRRTRLYPEAAGLQSGRLNWVPLANAVIQNKPYFATNSPNNNGTFLPEWVLLWPIPLREMQANPAFVGYQNPGWDR